MTQNSIKAGWHLLLVAAALLELKLAKTNLRRLLCGAAIGWHGVAAWIDREDLKDE